MVGMVRVVQYAYLLHEGHEVGGHSNGMLTNEAAGVGSHGVEVSQKAHVHLRGGSAHILQNGLVEDLRAAVGGRGGVLRALLIDGDALRLPVHRAGAGEHKCLQEQQRFRSSQDPIGSVCAV